MSEEKTKIFRVYGYDLLINTFESTMRSYIKNEILLLNYGKGWTDGIPRGVKNIVFEENPEFSEGCKIDEFFEEIYFLNLKDILLFSKNFKLANSFLGKISKGKFNEIMDELNRYRRKIAHAKSNFSEIDFEKLTEYVKMICQGRASSEISQYIKNEQYGGAGNIPPDFFEEYDCQNNLPHEAYDLDGGFVGRDKEVKDIINLLKSNQDRIITITGAGGVGKTAIALKVGYSFLQDYQNPYEAIIWFSAKENKLTEEGVVPLTSQIKSHDQLVKDILKLIDRGSLETFEKSNVPFDSYKKHLYNIFQSQKCLLIIDNLETIITDDSLTDLLKDTPRPTQVLITSRKGLGEIERRYPISDMGEKDAILLFRMVSKVRERTDLLKLKTETISRLVKRVRCYPLLIKWSVGQVCLGKDIEDAFSEILSGESEISKFSFNDVFELLNEDSKTVLFCMVVYGNEAASQHILMHLANVDDEEFESAMRELIMTSFVYPSTQEKAEKIFTIYPMLELTRGFVTSKLDDDEKTRDILTTRLYHLREQVEKLEKSRSVYSQSLFSLGIKTPDEQVAFNYVKTAKKYIGKDDKLAESYFKKALKTAPNLPYVYTEYSKFKFRIKHDHEAVELAKKGVGVGEDNWHTWFNYGIMLRKTKNPEESVKKFKRALELNPTHLPIHNELGRSCSFLGNYDDADKHFKKALREEKYPNYRHKIITLMFTADNYKRWAESFTARRDKTGCIEMLEKALHYVNEALKINRRDYKVLELYRRINVDLGVAITQKKGFIEGKPYLEKSVEPIKVGKRYILPRSRTAAQGYFFLAAYSKNREQCEDAEKYLIKAFAVCNPESPFFEKLTQLQMEIDKDKKREMDVRCGRIRSFDVMRKFGVIECGDEETYLFVLNSVRQMIPLDLQYELEGKSVSFITTKHPKKDELVASNIEILE